MYEYYKSKIDFYHRLMIRDILSEISREGINEQQSIYITFTTKYPGVSIPRFLQEKHTDSMTIVLQYDFEKLQVDNTGFSVVLYFNKKASKIRVSFFAIQSFVDIESDFSISFTPVSHEAYKSLPDIQHDNSVDNVMEGNVLYFSNFVNNNL